VIPPAIIYEAKNPEGLHYHYVLKPDGTVVSQTELKGSTTTYVTFESDGLSLTRPLRLIPGGDILADALDPTLTELVNAGYQDGEPIPADPRVPRPMTPVLISLGNLDAVPGTLADLFGCRRKDGARRCVESGDLRDQPLGEVGKLPVLGSLALPNSTLTTNKLSTTGGTFSPPVRRSPASTASPGGANPVKAFTDRINDAVNKVTGGGLQKDKPADSSHPE